jgi:hypothetical protein
MDGVPHFGYSIVPDPFIWFSLSPKYSKSDSQPEIELRYRLLISVYCLCWHPRSSNCVAERHISFEFETIRHNMGVNGAICSAGLVKRGIVSLWPEMEIIQLQLHSNAWFWTSDIDLRGVFGRYLTSIRVRGALDAPREISIDNRESKICINAQTLVLLLPTCQFVFLPIFHQENLGFPTSV